MPPCRAVSRETLVPSHSTRRQIETIHFSATEMREIQSPDRDQPEAASGREFIRLRAAQNSKYVSPKTLCVSHGDVIVPLFFANMLTPSHTSTTFPHVLNIGPCMSDNERVSSTVGYHYNMHGDDADNSSRLDDEAWKTVAVS